MQLTLLQLRVLQPCCNELKYLQLFDLIVTGTLHERVVDVVLLVEADEIVHVALRRVKQLELAQEPRKDPVWVELVEQRFSD